ncbi:hypothetical protein Salat_0942700 [Sesamum alatum]|uniref:Uncharacterized protein n=1 Tax=Sesamum alatum TaxID=300844 RepID=A0AAE1YL79_9LAMI|nr:hypothetical protein Salat_0942700 [Sesamum alatum]
MEKWRNSSQARVPIRQTGSPIGCFPVPRKEARHVSLHVAILPPRHSWDPDVDVHVDVCEPVPDTSPRLCHHRKQTSVPSSTRTTRLYSFHPPKLVRSSLSS